MRSPEGADLPSFPDVTTLDQLRNQIIRDPVKVFKKDLDEFMGGC